MTGQKRIISILLVFVLVLGCSTTVSFGASSITLSGASTPADSIYKGTSFVVKGTVSSTSKLTSVKVGVTDSKGNWKTGFVYSKNPKSKTFSLSKADSSLVFGKLPVGSYKYKVWAKNADGASKTLKNSAFQVVDTKIGSLKAPKAIYEGNSFSISGKITSKNKLSIVKVGVTTTGGSWISGRWASAKPNKKTYDISSLDAKIPFGKLDAGTYRFKVYIKDAKGTEIYLVNQKFTVSKMTISNASTPTTLDEGDGFVVKGNVKSHFNMSSVKVGVTKTNGSWTDVASTASVSGKTYNINKLDSKVKFGQLDSGTYYYKVWAKDVNGKSKTLKNKKFTVTGSSGGGSQGGDVDIDSEGKVLSYKSSVLSSIGAQPYSGPCGAYAMAYARMVIDGKFTKGNYSSIQDRIISSYYAGQLAQWPTAGGSNTYYSTAKSGYQAVLAEISSGVPCILRIQNGYTGNQHYVTVIGYLAGTTKSNVDKDSFVILDPAYGAKKYIKNMKYYDKVAVQVIKF